MAASDGLRADAQIIADTARPGTLEDSQALLSAILPVVDEHPPDVVRVALLVLLEAIDQREEDEAEQTRSRA